MPRMHFQISGQPRSVRASGGSAGTCGRTDDREDQHPAGEQQRPGRCEAPVAPIYMSPGERPSRVGEHDQDERRRMSWVMVPEAAMTPVA